MVQAPLTTCWYQVSFYQTVSDNNLYYHLMNCQIAPLSVLLLRLKTFYTEKNINPLLVKENTYGIINQKPTSLLKCTSRPWDRTTNFQPKWVSWINKCRHQHSCGQVNKYIYITEQIKPLFFVTVKLYPKGSVRKNPTGWIKNAYYYVKRYEI